MRLLVLVLSSTGGIYDQFKSNWGLCHHPEIDLYFIEYSEDIEPEYVISEKHILFRGKDSYIPGCLAKTVKSLQVMNLQKYDYIVRTNLSSVVHFQRLIDHLKTQPTERYYGGEVGLYKSLPLEKRYIINTYPGSDPNQVHFCAGALFVMSPDVAELLSKDKTYKTTPIIDDVQTGFIFQHLGLKPRGLLMMLNQHIDVTNPLHYHYRCRSPNRQLDVQRNREAFQRIYMAESGSASSTTIHPIPSSSSSSMSHLDVPHEIARTYKLKCDTPSDINEHLPTLRRYAAQCQSIVECGTRSVASSWAFLQGLSDSAAKNKSLILCDLDISANLVSLAHYSRMVDVDFEFVRGDDLKVDLPEADLYFIDTWDIYGQLKRELGRYKDRARKWIIMHDTTVDGVAGETVRYNANYQQLSLSSGVAVDEITGVTVKMEGCRDSDNPIINFDSRKKGLVPAIDEFLQAHPEWRRVEVFTNNNGLTVLGRTNMD